MEVVVILEFTNILMDYERYLALCNFGHMMKTKEGSRVHYCKHLLTGASLCQTCTSAVSLSIGACLE